jgi:hypothetical protein
MTSEDAFTLAERISAEHLWRVHELIIRPNYPHDTALRVKRLVYVGGVDDVPPIGIEATLTSVAEYEVLRAIATASTAADGVTLKGMPS